MRGMTTGLTNRRAAGIGKGRACDSLRNRERGRCSSVDGRSLRGEGMSEKGGEAGVMMVSVIMSGALGSGGVTAGGEACRSVASGTGGRPTEVGDG